MNTKLIKPSVGQELRRYIAIALGISMYVVAWIIFLIPNHIVGGGVVGLSSVIYIVSNTMIPVGVSNIVINAILLCFGVYYLGKKFAISNIYGIVVTSFWFMVFQEWLAIQDIDALIKLGNAVKGGLDPAICAVIGGVMSGIGIGIVLSNGGCSGGSDVVALILNKFYNVSLGSVIMVADALVIFSSLIIPGNDITEIVYGFLVLIAYTFTIDYVVDGRKQTYKILIFSKKNDELAEFIGNKIKRGVTFLNGTGWYTKQDIKVIMVVVHRNEKIELMRQIKRLDPDAFMTVEKTEGVFGKNFDTLKK
ncbi:MAG: YitT family protein [Bacteroidales bacterium]|nr:YitT family protein [Bacteroidales bacterium]